MDLSHPFILLPVPWTLQQSIFLVVIIESFADLRNDAAGEASVKQQKKPTVVLCGTNEISFKDIETQESRTLFKKRRQKYYFDLVEKVFILLVLVDAAVMAIKYAGMSSSLAAGLRYWQVCACMYMTACIQCMNFSVSAGHLIKRLSLNLMHRLI